MNCQTLVVALDEFLSGSSNAVVIEDNSQLFDLAQAKYSVSGESKLLAAFVVLRKKRRPAGAGTREPWRYAESNGAADRTR